MNLNLFFESLAADASRNFKIEQLEKNRNNEILRDVVRLALDPFTQFYIRKIPKYTRNNNPSWALQEGISRLYDLSSRTVTGNAAIAHLTNILSSLEPDDAKVIERIISKDLKCGVSVATANAVWTGLVSEYPVMLCSQYSEKLVNDVVFPAFVQLKMDGMRFNAIVRNGKLEYRSRNGKEIQLHGALDEQFVKLAGDMDCVFDGELLVKHGDVILDRQTGNGILNKAVKGTISDKEASMVTATVWDMIPYLYFVDGECPTPYETRFKRLKDALASANVDKVWEVNSVEVNDMDAANKIFHRYLSLGQEGIILKDKRGIWENKRAKHQIKFKGELECDLKIIEVLPGTGKYEGMLGSITCESSDGIINVNVGSGFNDYHRKTLKEEDLLGKIVAVKYNARIKNKAGEESLFLPIFVEVREDKTVPDSSKEIK